MSQELKDIRHLEYYDVSKDNPVIIKLKTSKRKKLYHYTNSSGAKGILQSGSLWITHSSYLDDITEIKYISLVLDGVIQYLKQNKELYDRKVEGQFYIYEAIIKTLEALRGIYVEGAPISGGNLFILSLSENSNNNYLLENYCGQDGAVFEFENNIKGMFEGNEYKFHTFSAKVEYDLGKQITLLLEDINDFYWELLNVLLNKGTADYLEVVETIKSIIYIKTINYSFFFKHHKYSKEQEYRVVFLVDENLNEQIVQHRMKDDRKIPFIEILFNENSLINTRFV